MKHSQVSLYIVIGLILLGITALVLVFTPGLREQGTQDREERSIQQMVDSCIRTLGEDAINDLALSGGSFYAHGRTYQNANYTYWCLDQGSKGCVSTGITRTTIAEELAAVVQRWLPDCTDLDVWRKAGYQVRAEDPQVRTIVGRDTVSFLVDYPITVEKGEHIEMMRDFAASIESELGILFQTALSIVAEQQERGWFDEDAYMRKSDKDLIIRKHQPYPDVVYSVEKYNPRTLSYLTFNFATQRPDFASQAGKGDIIYDPYDACLIQHDCYPNLLPGKCAQEGGRSNVSCAAEIIVPRRSRGQDCGEYKDGESWCDVHPDEITSFGYAPVGSRHYKKSCFNGEILTTECADYRNEICVQTEGRPYNAVCRPNRWQDCAAQHTEKDCLDQGRRDCFWADYLSPQEYIYESRQYGDTLCHPHVPPGFRFWEFGPAQDVCQMANELRHCSDDSCPQLWSDANAVYCLAMGDCGNSQNIDGVVTTQGYATSDKTERPDIYSYGDRVMGAPLSLALHVPRRQLVSQNTYHNERANTDAILEDLFAFAAEAATWTECTFCDCLAGVPIGNCEFNQYIHGSTRCNLWQAPANTESCERCGEEQRPCTEYWCRSLGQCAFRYEDGHGICEPVDIPEEPIELQVTAPGRTLDPALLASYKGFEIEEPYEPYSRMNLTIQSNIPVTCEASSLPWIFDDPEIADRIPLFSVFFRGFALAHTQAMQPDVSKTRYTYRKYITPWDRVVTHIQQSFNLTSLLDIGMIERYDRHFSGIKQNIDTVVRRFGDHVDLDHVSTKVDELFTKWTRFRPKIEFAMLRLGNVMRALLIHHDEGKSLVFFRCRDGIGNVKSTFISFKKSPDTTAPRLNITRNGTHLHITLSEPATCRYDREPRDFDDMRNNLNCTMYGLDMDLAPATCEGDIGTGDISVTCRDTPPYVEHHMITADNSSTFNSSRADIKIDGSRFIAADLDAAKGLTVKGPSPISLLLPHEENRTCGVNEHPSQNAYVYEPIPCYMTDSGEYCEVTITPPVQLDIACFQQEAYNERSVTIS